MLLAEYGHEVGALAFVVLQSQTDAHDVAAEVLADASTAADLRAGAPDLRLRLLKRAARRIRRHLGNGDAEPLLPDGTEAPETYAVRLAFLQATVSDRLLLALHHVAELELDEIATVMGMSRRAVRERVDDARNGVQARVERNGASTDLRDTPMGEIVDLADDDVR